MVLGGGDARLHDGPVLYTPTTGGMDPYVVGIEGAKLGDVALPLPEGSKALIDTGTSLMIVPQAFFDAVAQELQRPELCAAVPYLCPTEAVPMTVFE